MMRMRSSSLSESNSTKSPVQEICSLAMTPEERHNLEQEVRAQHHHPLTMRLEAEEAERRMRNQMEYYRRAHERTDASRLQYGSRPSQQYGMRLYPQQQGPREGRDWNRIVDAFERRGSGNGVQSLDDLVVLEAAIMLSMEEEARRRGEAPPSSRNASMDQFDAERHASANFPLARARVSENRLSLPGSSLQGSSTSSVLTGRANGSGRLSEEQQIAMAIQASLQESGGDRQEQWPSHPPSR
jgi:hypothetical protein